MQDRRDNLVFCEDHVDIQFLDLCYCPPGKKGKASSQKLILENVSGSFHSGHLTAILGPSGAGKTTLMNVLTGFKTGGVSGRLLVNGKERDLKRFRKQCCYIPQEISLFPLLTARETLQIAADLKLDANIGKQKKTERVNEVLEILGLEKVAEKSVSKLSGGEKKRLSIGPELLTNPPVMFLDEPTSGLDSMSALQIITHLKSLARSGRTVVCSIHQPSSRLFQMFDDAFVISEGRCLYNGPIEDMTAVFAEEGFECPNFYNRADFAIEIASGEQGECLDKLISRFGHKELDVTDHPRNGCIEASLMLTEKKSKEDETCIAIHNTYREDIDSSYPVSIFYQFLILLKRSFLCSSRDLMAVQLRIFFHLLIGILLGVLYYNAGNDATKTFSNFACIFFIVLFLFFCNAMPSVVGIPQEAAIFVHEHLNNWYSLRAYYFAKTVMDFPLVLLCSTLFIAPAYYLTDQPIDGFRPYQFWILCLLVLMTGHYYGLMIGAAFPNPQLNLFLMPALNVPLVLFSGFFLNLEHVPEWLKWMTDISYFRYAFEGAMQCIYGNNRTSLECPDPYCYLKSPKKILKEFNMLDAVFECDIMALVVWVILLKVALFCVLKWKIYVSH